MKFENVEILQKKYSAKSQDISKKHKKIVLITCAVVFSINFIILIFVYFFISKPKTTSLLSIFPVLVIFFIEWVFINVLASLSTSKDKVVLSEYYLAYKRAYKAYFIHRQLAKLFTNLYYDHNQGIDQNLLKASGLIYTGDIYKSNDLVQAKYKNVNFIQSDVEIIDKQERRDKDGNIETYYVTVFKGRYLIFEFPKKFEFKMTVSYGGHGASHINPKTGRGLSRIETESPDFNKRFLVYAEDGFEAFYILSPDVMDRLERLGEKYKNALSLYFSDNKLYVGLNDNNDSFEPPHPSKPLNEKEEEQKVIKDMELITELVDNLKLSK